LVTAEAAFAAAMVALGSDAPVGTAEPDGAGGASEGGGGTKWKPAKLGHTMPIANPRVPMMPTFPKRNRSSSGVGTEMVGIFCDFDFARTIGL